MHWMSIVGLIMITVGTILSFLGSQYSEKSNQEQLTQKIQEKNTTIDSINSSNIKLINQSSGLLNSNKEMITLVSQYQSQIEQREKKIRELEEKVSLTERGIESKIHFNGSRRIKQGGLISLNLNTEECGGFDKMLLLEKQHDHISLIKICEEYILKNPKWYTSYYFKALALLNTDAIKNRQKALDLFDFVSKNTVGDIEYVSPLFFALHQMKENTRINFILSKVSLEALQTIENEDLRKTMIEYKKQI